MILVTDLFRPYADPDDHWDLACVFALTETKDIDLKGILIDYPPQRRQNRNPDVMAVAQLNYMTGHHVPVTTGSPYKMKSRTDILHDATPSELGGVQMILDILRSSDIPVIITITGRSLDVAVAGNRDPELFSKKCAAIYLNAGTGSPNKELAKTKEYNVRLDEISYASIFDLPCPVYWMPCFEDAIKVYGERVVKSYGTFYRFRHQDILPDLSPALQNFFAFMYRKNPNPYWLSSLSGQSDQEIISEINPTFRNMWCTGGFFHAVGKTVTKDGHIVSLREAANSAVYSLDPIRVKCDNNGVTEWHNDENSKDRFIFHIRDVQHYQSAMSTALKSLLQELH